MENDNLGGGMPAEGVDTSIDVSDSSPESNSAQDPLRNVKAEMNRKISKLDTKIDQLIQTISQSRTSAPAVEADITEAPEYKRYVDARFQEVQKDQIKRGQQEAWQKALQLFPELNQESDHFDERFYKKADEFYSSFDLSRDPEAPLKAVKLAAVEVGKIEQLTREKLLRDEARRSRMIAEGGMIPRDTKKEKEPVVNEQNLARLGIKGKSLERLKQELKNNGGEK